LLMLPILEGDHKQDINSMLMLPILEGDHKQDTSIGNISNTVDVLCMVSLKYW
jgi:hypothetical protein